MMSDKYDRRNVLSGIATAIGTASLATGTVTARRRRSRGDKIEVWDRAEVQLARGNTDEALAILDEAGINYSMDRTVRPFGHDSSDELDGGVSTQDAIDYHESDVRILAGEAGGSRYRATLDLVPRLDGVESIVDSVGPNDAVGISYSSDKMRPIPGSEDYNGTYFENYDPGPEGCLLEFNDYNWLASGPDRLFYRQTLEKTEPGTANLYGHYSHTWETGHIPGGVTFGISFGALSVSTTSSVDSWKQPTPIVEI